MKDEITYALSKLERSWKRLKEGVDKEVVTLNVGIPGQMLFHYRVL